MKGWVLLVDTKKDADTLAGVTLDAGGIRDTPGRYSVLTTRAYLANPQHFRGMRPKVINLSRSYTYQSRGYYASLLAEARGHRVIPTVETMIELYDKMLYSRAIPELEEALRRCVANASEADRHAALPDQLLVCFGQVADIRFERFGRLLFDWFRAPVLLVRFDSADDGGGGLVSGKSAAPTSATANVGDTSVLRIKQIAPRPAGKLTDDELAFFCGAMDAHTRREWRSPRAKTASRYSFATLVDPAEKMPPSSRETLRHWARVAEKMGVEVEPITKKDLPRLAEFDALFIRETTSIDNHTYRFARRAVQEGMPVIDDPVSMIRCTNKVYLQELLTGNGVPVPPAVIVSRTEDLARAADELGFPMVLKIPDSSFSRGVKKVDNEGELRALAKAWMKDSDLIIAQRFIPTTFDWRVGVLDGRPLFVSQYRMARAHWQIVKHRPDGEPIEGGFSTPKLSEAPPEVIDIGMRAARLIGNGLYGVDLKETADGIYVIEVNDNPNLDHGVEDAAEKDAVWRALTQWFIGRLEE